MTASSRRRYTDYRQRLRARGKASQVADVKSRESAAPRTRSFGQLFVSFLGLLRGHRGAIALALGTLTISTILHLAPPLATKLVIDNVLSDGSLPRWWTEQLGLSTDRLHVLYLVGAFIGGVSILATIIHVSGRWLATKAVNKLQVAIRRRVF